MEMTYRTYGTNKSNKGSSKLPSLRKDRLGQAKEKMVFTVVLCQNRPGAYSVRIIMTSKEKV
jgi:hypothetical protein